MFHRHQTLTIPFWLPLLVVAGYLFSGLGAYGLLDNNEGLYAEIAREMSRGSSLVIPHVLGLPYMEKPPLLYYLVAASFQLFGETETAARLVPMGASLLSLAGVYWLCRRLGRPETGKLAVMILASSMGWMLMSRVVMFDMLFTGFFTLALFAFLAGWIERAKGVVRFAWGCLALALLSKGFMALILAGLVLVPWLLLAERRRIPEALAFLLDWRGILLFLAIATPWHLLAAGEHPRFAWFYFINEHVLRFLGQRIPHDYYAGPAWYYLPRLLLALFPWAFFLLLSLVRTEARGEPEQRLSTFLWWAWLAPLAFFSVSSAKANYYIVVLLPPLAILLALQLEALVAAGRTRLLALPAGLILVLLLAGATVAYLKRGLGELTSRPEAALWIAMAAALLIIAGAALWLALRDRPASALAAVALLLCPIQVCLLLEMGEREPALSGKPLARAIAERCAGCEVLLYKDFENISALPFYLPRPPAIVDSVSNDLWFARQQDPDHARFVSSGTLEKTMARRRLALVVLKERQADFNASPLAARFRPAATVGRATLYLN